MFPSAVDVPQKKPNIIQATLVFNSPRLPEIQELKVIEDLATPVEPETIIPIVATPEDTQIEPDIEPELKAPQISPPETKQNQDKPEKPAANNNAVETKTAVKNITPTAILNSRAPATSLARRHLKSLQQQQQNKVAAQASKDYRLQKNSPEINTQIQDPFMSEDEKIMDSLKVRADCSSTSKQTAAVLLSFLGGQIDCSTPPAINSFIQDRINKKSHVPSQPIHKKRPQSVVINK